MSKLQGKIAVVTGASKGIGAGIARELAAAGAAIVVNYASDRIAAESVVDTIVAAGGHATAIQADVGKAADVARLFEQARVALGSLDILVNNAGVFQAMPVTELTVLRPVAENPSRVRSSNAAERQPNHQPSQIQRSRFRRQP